VRYFNVKSSSVKRIGYDKRHQILSIEYADHGPYNYYDVPEEIFEGLLESPSKGEYVNRKIRQKYDYSKPDFEM
jgi:hypothetical protein